MTEPTFESLKARCAQAGVQLLTGVDFEGTRIFIVEKFGYFKELPTLLAVENWLAWTGQGMAKTR